MPRGVDHLGWDLGPGLSFFTTPTFHSTFINCARKPARAHFILSVARISYCAFFAQRHSFTPTFLNLSLQFSICCPTSTISPTFFSASSWRPTVIWLLPRRALVSLAMLSPHRGWTSMASRSTRPGKKQIPTLAFPTMTGGSRINMPAASRCTIRLCAFLKSRIRVCVKSHHRVHFLMFANNTRTKMVSQSKLNLNPPNHVVRLAVLGNQQP